MDAEGLKPVLHQHIEGVVIGVSAGAVDALDAILPALPGNFPAPIMVVVHLPVDRRSIMAELFQGRSRLEIKEAEDKEPTRPGVVYFAPPDYHLLVEPDRSLSLSRDEPILYSRPSIDVLFESAADSYGEALLGIVLTGANSDGAHGLQMICDAGGVALVQQPSTAHVPTMPQAALTACPDAIALSLEQIRIFLLELATGRPG